MDKILLKVPATIQDVKTMPDKCLKLTVETQELTPQDKASIMDLHEKLGWFVFSEQGIEIEDLKDLPKIELEEGEKQPSQRLRSVIYILWEQKKIAEPFDSFYKRQIEKVIDTIKAKLN